MNDITNISLSKLKEAGIGVSVSNAINKKPDKNAIIACDIVRFVFQNINECVQSDRSMKKLSFIEKGVIKGMLNERTLKGIDDYIKNMYPNDIRELSSGIKKLANDFEV